jgi:hypothetical protein
MNYRRHKFGAKSTRYNGQYYPSQLEANKAIQLDWMKKAGEIKEWHPQHKWELYVNGKKICGYKIDFRVVNVDGTIDYIETKGAQTYDFMLKWNLTQALFDELTAGEDARLYLNEKCVMQSFKSA